ncbi:uncharacterized protein LOC117565551 [Drosophila albomicans]|uniref:Uncharacterized protein LOC117565551 n=1 Tax=Drosophila albomicans TaxID=7291 RepID=A0A6P8WMS1_DROAB|nr:uncharacterized protein LOC117565551 [Drosophila albomicans]
MQPTRNGISHSSSMLRYGALFLLLLSMASSVCAQRRTFETSITSKLNVDVCPDMPIMKNVKKTKLLGYWYAYATTPLPFRDYQRRCASYNVRNATYFDTNILYTNYKSLTITYSCKYVQKKDKWNIKLRILTRTRTPMASTIKEAVDFLEKVKFPLDTLDWLKSEAFCFEWYQLKIETGLRPKDFQAPFNRPGD